MIRSLLYTHIWIVLLCWALVYISDYYLTLITARGRQKWIKDHIVFEGSFELTPVFQADIDALRVFSPTFLVRLVISIFIITVAWVVANEVDLPQFFFLIIGGLFLREAAIHLRHLRNLAQIWLTRNGDGLSGQIVHSRWLIYQLSAADLGGYSALFAVLALVLASWSFAGGSLFCGVTAIQHWRLGQKAAARTKLQDA